MGALPFFSYSHVNRPTEINIDRSSPTQDKQIRGEFVTEEDRIANLFGAPKN